MTYSVTPLGIILFYLKYCRYNFFLLQMNRVKKKKQRENIMLWQQNLYFVCNIITGVSGTKNIFIYWRQHKHLITYLIQLMNLKCIVYNINYHLDFLKKKNKIKILDYLSIGGRPIPNKKNILQSQYWKLTEYSFPNKNFFFKKAKKREGCSIQHSTHSSSACLLTCIQLYMVNLKLG